MTRPVALVLDSSTSIYAPFLDEYDITVLPNTMIWDGKEYRDNVDIKITNFIARLETGKTFPSTAAVTPEAYRAAFQELVDAGKDVLYVGPTRAMTRNPLAAMEASKEVNGGAVRVVETKTFGMGTGWSAVVAAREAKNGAGIDACEAVAQSLQGWIIGFANRLDLLAASGRISRLQSFIGSGLNLKPILETDSDGRINATDRVRTRSRAIDHVTQKAIGHAEGRGEVYVSIQHVAAEDDAQRVLDILEDHLTVKETTLNQLNPNPAAHFGPGTVGICLAYKKSK